MENQEPGLKIELHTPDKKTINMHGFAVLLPAEDGIREIRPYHTSFIGKLTFGEMKFFHNEDSGEFEAYAIHSGFFKIMNDTLKVLVHSAEKVKEIDVERARQAKKRANGRLDSQKEKEGEVDFKRAQLALRRALNRIALWEQYRSS